MSTITIDAPLDEAWDIVTLATRLVAVCQDAGVDSGLPERLVSTSPEPICRAPP